MDAQLVRFSTMLTVRDLPASEAYYVRHFGVRVTERLEGLQLLERPGVALYLTSESPPTADKPNVSYPFVHRSTRWFDGGFLGEDFRQEEPFEQEELEKIYTTHGMKLLGGA